ncbi:cytochrome P450 [Streptomyces sp. NPDC005963]|uniref:cytochrome P450 n=1 Tax=Streptomyces sp. NPDC005963 TaxID=3156721 RepID=UPI0033F4D11B
MSVSLELSAIPRAPGAIPLLGHTLKLMRGPLAFMRSLRESGEFVRVDIGTLPVCFATSPALVHEVTVNKARSFEKGRLFQRVRPLVGNGLATADGDTHRRHRRLMQPMFHRQQISGYVEVMGRHADALAESWTPGQRVDVHREVTSLTIRTLAETLFSAEIGRQAVDTVSRELPVVMKNMLMRTASPQLLDGLPLWRSFDRATANMRSVIDRLVVQTRAAGPRDGRADLLSVLLEARDADTGEALTDEEVRDELVTILFAGSETTASVLSWALHHLSLHPEIARAAAVEIEEVTGGEDVGFADVPRLSLIQRVLDESLRLHGVVLLMRRALEPVEIGGYTLPAGTEVAFSLYALHRDPTIYSAPDVFDPDRWLPERRAELPREAVVPFGSGNRKCIGDAFAWTQATVALATILRRWRLGSVEGHTPREMLAAMANPDRVLMTVHPRIDG